MRQNLIFVHGFRGNGLGLKELATKYFPTEDYKCYILEVPPAGGKSLTEYTANNYAKFVADYIKKNKIKKPVLIGHSMGSIICAAVAERYPELIGDKLIFLSPISVKPAKFFAMLTPLTAILPNKIIGYISTKYMFIPKDKKLLKNTLKTTYLCGADYTTKKDVFKSAKFSSSCAIDDFNIKKDILFLSGEKDRLIPRQKTEAVARKYSAKTAYVKGTGHLLNYENPKETATVIKRFLAR